MKWFVLLLLLTLSACSSESNVKHKYFDFNNALERSNLLGKVKEVILYESKSIDSRNNEQKDLRLVSIKRFTSFGEFESIEIYDNSGKLLSISKKEYNEKNKLIHSFDSSLSEIMVTEEFLEYDLNGNHYFSKGYFKTETGENKMKVYIEHDSMKNISKCKMIQDYDTAITEYIYKYNSNKQKISKKQIQIHNNEKFEYLTEFKYDNSGNLIEEISFDSIPVLRERKNEHEYSSENILKRTTNYKNNQIEQITEFDDSFNQVLIKFYGDGYLTIQRKYEYQFDSFGNWIERKILIKQADSKEFIPMTKEMRKIVYY